MAADDHIRYYIVYLNENLEWKTVYEDPFNSGVPELYKDEYHAFALILMLDEHTPGRIYNIMKTNDLMTLLPQTIVKGDIYFDED